MESGERRARSGDRECGGNPPFGRDYLPEGPSRMVPITGIRRNVLMTTKSPASRRNTAQNRNGVSERWNTSRLVREKCPDWPRGFVMDVESEE